MQKNHAKPLRYGFSTGACLSALGCGLWQFLQTKACPPKIMLTFLDGAEKELPLKWDKINQGILQIQKDGGDDPDCTHLAILSASLFQSTLENAAKEDYLLSIGRDTLILHATHGIGLCTRKGLDCEEGKWAVNICPRQMLINNLQKYGMGQNGQNNSPAHVWQLNIGVENGEELAKKTLNQKLGIIGGISILGTTGHVKPFSHDAYIQTIRICVRTVKLEHGSTAGSHVVFGTGARSLACAKKFYPNLPENAFIPIADFIGKSLEIAREENIAEISIACMAGKLCKYAGRQSYTHAHDNEQDLSVLAAQIQELSLAPEDILNTAWQDAQSVREALCSFTQKTQYRILAALAKKALCFFQSIYPAAVFHLLVCDFDGNILLTMKSGKQNVQ